MSPLTIGSLFSGIGGFELGLERAGLGPVRWQVESDPYCQRVLDRHWPQSNIKGDVRNVGWWPAQQGKLTEGCIYPVDVIAGGFPCQDVSWANTDGLGLDGERSGLWREFYRIVREIRPRYVAIENVAALLHRGLATVLGDLARIGYDAEWSVVSACSVGAPHVRRRLFVVAYPHRVDGRPRLRHRAPQQDGPLSGDNGFARARAGWQARLANPSALYGGADGIPARLVEHCSERNHAIGNAVCPAVGEVIGRVIVALEAERLATEAA